MKYPPISATAISYQTLTAIAEPTIASRMPA